MVASLSPDAIMKHLSLFLALMAGLSAGVAGASDVAMIMRLSHGQDALPDLADGDASKGVKRAEDGHFYVVAKVNGIPIRFLVDTGSSLVVLRTDDAARAGIRLNAADFNDAAITAGGDVAIAPVTLDSVTIGTIETRDVEAAVDDGGLDVSLLGQTYLNRLRGMVIDGDRLVMR